MVGSSSVPTVDVEIYQPRLAARSPADLDLFLAYVHYVVIDGSPQEHRSLYEALIDNIEITHRAIGGRPPE
jgi:hypothetical protein